MENIKYFPNPVPENPEDLRRYINDELQRIAQFADQTQDDFIVPDSANIVVGGTPVGTIVDAQVLKDGNYYQVPEVNGAFPSGGFNIEFNFSNVRAIKGFVSMIRYTGGATHLVTLRLWDYVNAQDDTFYDIPHTATRDAYRTVLIPDDTKYINNSSQSLIRLLHESAGSPTHNIFIDYIALIGTRNARY